MKKTKSFIVMNAGIFLLAIGVYFFKIPNGFSTGGVTGIGTIFGALTPISAGAWILILNAVLLVVGFIFFGKGTGIKTVYCSMMYSALTYIFEIIVPLDSPLSDQPLLELIYAMMLTSVGSAMIFQSNASSGGT
ncbi:MAG: YitT family protein, partial [Clostridia bacterium]|nr:YitT family protein [Clostridia bacterium]